jgi:hypothetical protein
MIAFDIKTNYKIAILIVIQSSMPKINIPKKNTIKPLILGDLAAHGGPLIIWNCSIVHHC